MTQNEIYDNLIKQVKLYQPNADLNIVEKAYMLANDAHKGQLRQSGEPYIIHPLSVAVILAELELDLGSIVAGILHDVIEDTAYTYEDIASMFSTEIADLVDGVTKLDKIDGKLILSEPNEIEDVPENIEKSKDKNYREELQAENYRKMFLAMAKDIRVVLIKIADRLHNMRTLKYKPEDRQKYIAQETLEIYAPLAHRLGISTIRYELEDLCFHYLNPEAYYELANSINLKLSERKDYITDFVSSLKTQFKKENMDVDVQGRPKHFFSIYKKMHNKNKTLDQIYDLFAVRIICNTVRDCYEVLGIVHEMHTPIPGRFKDYIAMPKPNMYQSLHTVIIGPEGEPVEIQIRTWDMHRTSEYGIAAHWRYKEGNADVTPANEEEKLSWLRQILDWQRDMSDNKEFLSAIKVDLDVFTDHVYCFTPHGEIIGLLRASTPIDFAYAIHSAVGNRMIGAKVNGAMVPIDFQLNSGDIVEVITSNNSRGPSRDWLKVVHTSQARNKINQWFKNENKDDSILKGNDMLEKEAKKKGLNFNEVLTEKMKSILLNRFSYRNWDTLCATVGYGGLREGQVINRIIYELNKEEAKKPTIEIDNSTSEKNKGTKSGIAVAGIGDINVRFSKCCNPVPGDEIIGFITRGRGVSIHRTDCINIINLSEFDKNRLLEAEWQLPDSNNGVAYRADIQIIGDDRNGLLIDISKVLSEEKLTIKALNAHNQDGESVFNISMEIFKREQLEKVQAKIKKLSGVHSIERVMG